MNTLEHQTYFPLPPFKQHLRQMNDNDLKQDQTDNVNPLQTMLKTTSNDKKEKTKLRELDSNQRPADP